MVFTSVGTITGQRVTRVLLLVVLVTRISLVAVVALF